MANRQWHLCESGAVCGRLLLCMAYPAIYGSCDYAVKAKRLRCKGVTITRKRPDDYAVNARRLRAKGRGSTQ